MQGMNFTHMPTHNMNAHSFYAQTHMVNNRFYDEDYYPQNFKKSTPGVKVDLRPVKAKVEKKTELVKVNANVQGPKHAWVPKST